MRTRIKRKSGPSLEARIMSIGSDLARSFTDVLEALPGAPHRPQFLARSLGVNTVLTSRLLKAAQQHDPLTVAHIIPGPEPLRRLLRAAARKKIDPDLINQARAAVDQFEQLIDAEAGDRSALDAIISGFLPDARAKVELIAKQSVFRGMSQLLGSACELQHSTTILYPSEAPGFADALCLFVTQGLRRVRPGLTVDYQSVHSDTPMFSVTGRPVEDLQGLLLEEFCSQPVPRLQVTRYRGFDQYALCGEDVGVRSAVTLAMATYLPRKKQIHRNPDDPPRKATAAVGIGAPTRIMIVDLLLHPDVYPDQDPTLHIYRTVGVFDRRAPEPSRQGNNERAAIGAVDSAVRPMKDPRQAERMEVLESIQSLGKGLQKFRSSETLGYQDMLGRLCQQRGWEGAKLRGYRCRIEYPIYSSEIVMAFDLPLRS